MATLRGTSHPGSTPATPGSTYVDLSTGKIYIQTSTVAYSPLWVQFAANGTVGGNKDTPTGSASGGAGSLSGTTGLTSTTSARSVKVMLGTLVLPYGANNSLSPVTVNHPNITADSHIMASLQNVNSSAGLLTIRSINPIAGSVNVILQNSATGGTFSGSADLVLDIVNV